jgi:hypothetical protein
MCSKAYNIDESKLGKTAKCSCGNRFVLAEDANQVKADEPDVIQYDCEQCNSVLETEASHMGQTEPCPLCGRKNYIQIPKSLLNSFFALTGNNYVLTRIGPVLLGSIGDRPMGDLVFTEKFAAFAAFGVCVDKVAKVVASAVGLALGWGPAAGIPIREALLSKSRSELIEEILGWRKRFTGTPIGEALMHATDLDIYPRRYITNATIQASPTMITLDFLGRRRIFVADKEAQVPSDAGSRFRR